MDIEKIKSLEAEIVEKKANLKALEKELGKLRGGYEGPLPRPACLCEGWGCWGCSDTERVIRAKEGTYG